MPMVFQGGGTWGRVLFLTGMAGATMACGGGGTSDASAAGSQQASGPPPTAVELAAAERGTVSRSVTVTGLSEPVRSIGVNSQLAGALLAVNVQEGDLVREGQVLARLDARELEAQMGSAEASLEVTKNTFERSTLLRQSGVITEAEFDRDRAAYRAAQAQTEQLRTRLGYATIRAPITGVVTQKRLEAGDLVAPQTRLFTVADMSTMLVRVQVSELDVLSVRIGQDVNVALDALPGRPLPATVRRVFPSADTLTRLVPVEVALTGEGARLARAGFLARVTFDLDRRRDVVLVPQGALVGASGAHAVFLVRDGRAVRRPVSTGLVSEGRVEIVSGLEGGEMVVVAGNATLRDGAEVRVTGPTAPRVGGDAATRISNLSVRDSVPGSAP